MNFRDLSTTTSVINNNSSYNPTFDGVALETTGVRVLSVDGRHKLENDIILYPKILQDGAVFVRSRRQPRPLTIQVLVEGTSDQDLFTKIDTILGKVRSASDLVFADMANYHFGVVFVSYSMSEHTVSNQVMLNMDFICPDPNIYKTAVNLGPGKSIIIPTNTVKLPSRPKITFTATLTNSYIRNNRGQTIHLVNLSAGDVVVIDLTADEPFVTVNGNVRYGVIDVNGDFGLFTVKPGDTITAGENITIVYREVRG